MVEVRDDSEADLHNPSLASIFAGPTLIEPEPATKKRVAIGLLPGDGSYCKETTRWLMNLSAHFARSDEYEAEVIETQDTPADMVRNRIARAAQQAKFDYLLMVDSDMEPDYYSRPGPDQCPTARPFVSTALQFLKNLGRPAVIAAPYCGPPPDEFPYIFDWKCGHAGPDFKDKLQMVSRDIAAIRRGVHQAAALPTGLMLIDMRVFDILPPPWFYYEYTDKFHTNKASTEDVTFSRDCTLARIPIYCLWDSWARHVKTIRVPRPDQRTVDIVMPRMRDILIRAWEPGDTLVEVGTSEGRSEPQWPADLPKFASGVDPTAVLPIIPGSHRGEVVTG